MLERDCKEGIRLPLGCYQHPTVPQKRFDQVLGKKSGSLGERRAVLDQLDVKGLEGQIGRTTQVVVGTAVDQSENREKGEGNSLGAIEARNPLGSYPADPISEELPFLDFGPASRK